MTGAVLSLQELAEEVRDGTAYQDQIELLGRRGIPLDEAIRALHLYDARWACDVLGSVFAATKSTDGWVSAELDPRFADDARAAIAEARAIVSAVNRPNLLVKVPGTPSGLKVVSDCVAEGIGVNATHISSVQRYGELIEAYFEGLERALASGRPLTASVSVASFEAARMGIMVDASLDGPADEGTGRLRGRAALALARAAYDLYEERLGSDRWRKLRTSGARPQRLVWTGADTAGTGGAAGTGDAPDTKHAPVRHVEELVAWSTVHAMSQPTLTAVARWGRLSGDTLTGESSAADEVLTGLRQHGVSIDRMAEELTRAAVQRSVSSRLDLDGSVRDRLSVLDG
ncbi:transaldolase family protein [Streptomyces inhibens]|uniref:transaldolase family protein n=1 Tax=Streptomyces inhibens TaxID=2293571 RepID=UPI00315AB006